ncbi:hypothetical protein LEN26_015740 [Aphanomyces euteiches]|nr:hypothetical protein LEN26_015740 [Aphanomyces euteiches]KAH9114528.1 hypothetical protein AeMF1_011394 [Aphanomyces euteiches]KAH9188532.1 hypothetical protein AeNC1_009500 [Aphanomyces euteiches]
MIQEMITYCCSVASYAVKEATITQEEPTTRIFADDVHVVADIASQDEDNSSEEDYVQVKTLEYETVDNGNIANMMRAMFPLSTVSYSGVFTCK